MAPSSFACWRGHRATSFFAAKSSKDSPRRPVFPARLCCRLRRHRAEKSGRSEEHTSELQPHHDLVCRLLLLPLPPASTLFPTRRSSDLAKLASVSSMTRSRDGSLLFCLLEGAQSDIVLRGEKFERLAAPAGFSRSALLSVAQTQSGEIWEIGRAHV